MYFACKIPGERGIFVTYIYDPLMLILMLKTCKQQKKNYVIQAYKTKKNALQSERRKRKKDQTDKMDVDTW